MNEQRRRRGWKGYIATLPNCTATGLAITLKALDARFGVEATMVTTMQGISGAGRDLSALDIVENVIPFIPREEERVMVETRKILGAHGRGRDRGVGAPRERHLYARRGAQRAYGGGRGCAQKARWRRGGQ